MQPKTIYCNTDMLQETKALTNSEEKVDAYYASDNTSLIIPIGEKEGKENMS